MAVALFVSAVLFLFRMHACIIISNWAWSFDVQKRKASSSTRRLESIVSYCYGLLNCSGAVHYCWSSILSEFCNRGSTGFEVCYRRSMDLTLPIHSDHLQMRLLGYNGASFGFLTPLRRYFRASYDWNSRLHFPSRWPPPVPFPFLCMGNGRFTSVLTGRNGTKTTFLSPTVIP